MKLEGLRNAIKKMDQIIGQAAQDVHSEMDQRIFDEGNNIAGKTASYSKKEMYVSDKNSPKRIPQGKKIGKRGKKIKSGYFANGYFEYKKAIGRKNSFVNFQLSGELRKNFLGGLNRSKKGVWTISLRTKNKEISDGLDNKYGTVFRANQKEQILFKKRALELFMFYA